MELGISFEIASATFLVRNYTIEQKYCNNRNNDLKIGPGFPEKAGGRSSNESPDPDPEFFGGELKNWFSGNERCRGNESLLGNFDEMLVFAVVGVVSAVAVVVGVVKVRAVVIFIVEAVAVGEGRCCLRHHGG